MSAWTGPILPVRYSQSTAPASHTRLGLLFISCVGKTLLAVVEAMTVLRSFALC